jgi:L-asparagine oxygenase
MDFQHIIAQVSDTGYFLASNISSTDFQCFVLSSGNAQVDSRHPEQIREIRPQAGAEANPNTLSSRYGLGAFPFHTDVAHWEIPARFLVLYCEIPGSGQRPTHLQDSCDWAPDVETKRAALREVWKCGHTHPRLCTLGKVIGNRFALRFDEACMTPMTNSAAACRDQLRRKIEACPILDIHWSVGDMLVLDNHRMLHARGRACAPDYDRVIKRALLGDPG